ncbi:MAG: GNAT family N-acetyltransferase, partial [Solirubrobacteraceae bacterium]
VVAGVVAGFGHWWMAPAALALGLAVLLGARHLIERFAHRPIVRGLAVLADRRRRRMLLALVTAIAALTAGRVWLVLVVCGLPHGFGEVAWVFATLGTFGLLPIGPSAPAGATLAALGTSSVGGAVAAGLLLSVSSIAAVVIYGLACVRPRTPRMPAPCHLGWSMLHTLPNGTRVRLRFVESRDKALLAAGMTALSARSRRQRFLAPKSQLTADELRYLSEVDGHDHVALVAVLEQDPSVLVGVARFVRDPERPDEAEVAITVGDPWQGAGMGRRLGEALADAARSRGVRRFTATLLGSNAAAHALFASISRRVTTQHTAGIADLVAELETAEHRTAA